MIVDIRPVEQRSRDGELPGAVVIDRNVLEWRLDPTSPHRIDEIDGPHRPVVIVCNEGYQSSLAAETLRRLGLHGVVDLDGGYQAWLTGQAVPQPNQGDSQSVSATKTLLSNNESYARGFTQGDLPMSPAAKVAVVACMDARLDPARILGLQDGDAHVIRNAGGVVTEDAIRSLTISQRLLGTEEIILIHHTDCGMLTFSEDEVKTQIAEETGIRPPFALEAFSDLDQNVRQSIARIQASPFVPNKDAVRGFVYEVETGRLREVAR